MLYTPLTAEQLGHMRVIVDSSELLLRLVNDILDLSKIEAGKLEFADSRFNLESLIEDALCLLSFKANEKRLELACWYPPEIPRNFSGDAGRLRQVLINLISNAVKFTDAGHVLVEVEAAAQADGQCMVRLSVRDTGIGVAKEKQRFLFDSFRQADATIFSRFGGTGLGLSIVKQIVELMGGHVSVSSVEGQGALFCCDIPLTATNDMAAEWPPRLPVSELQGTRVLICGGAQIRQSVMARWCEYWGMKVDQCQTTDGLASHMADTAFELVIVESHPEGCRSVLSALRRFTGRPIPKIVLVSTGPVDGGADAVLLTPVRAQVLCQTLVEVLGRRKTPVVEIAPISPDGASISQSSGCRVLVTDDNPINQKLAAALLSRMGCQVDIADSGLSALEKVNANEYDLVLMDCVMPGMDGFETTAAIRKLAGKPRRVPIVALTASATTQDRDKCLAVGMDDFLTKPIRREQLLECVSRWSGKAVG
jgi:CheY-like chemotaxis protein